MTFEYEKHTIEIQVNTSSSWVIVFDNDKLKFLVKGRTDITWSKPKVKAYIIKAIEFAKLAVKNDWKPFVQDEILDIIQWLDIKKKRGKSGKN